MTGILEKPTTNNSRSNVHYLFSVRNMFFSNFGGWPDLNRQWLHLIFRTFTHRLYLLTYLSRLAARPWRQRRTSSDRMLTNAVGAPRRHKVVRQRTLAADG